MPMLSFCRYSFRAALLTLLTTLVLSLFSPFDADAVGLRPFTSDGCSLFPDGTIEDRTRWCDCCLDHDIAYWQGGTADERKKADEALRDCVLERTNDKGLSETVYLGVRAGGHPVFPAWYRWGYGSTYGRGYTRLSDAEKLRVRERLDEYWQKNPTGYCGENNLKSASVTVESGPAAVKQETQESAKRRMARAEMFLLRAYEELDKFIEYQKAVIEGLEKRKHPGTGADIRPLLDWQRNFSAWLRERHSESVFDLENFYSHKMIRPALAARYSEMADDYTRLGNQVADMAQQVDEAKKLNRAEIQNLTNIIEFYVYMTEEAAKKRIDEKWKPDRRPPDGWLSYSKKLNDEELERLRLRINQLEDSQKDLDVMLEFERYEIQWLSLKTGDSSALSNVARAVELDSLDMIATASLAVIKRYEADISFLTKKLREIDGARTRLSGGPGTMKTLDRREELWDYYWTMKTRFEHHIQWLKEQAGAYRADLVLLGKERGE